MGPARARWAPKGPDTLLEDLDVDVSFRWCCFGFHFVFRYAFATFFSYLGPGLGLSTIKPVQIEILLDLSNK